MVQDKYLACDPLPDVDNERDLTSFITLWTEGKDKDLKSAIKQCQVAENVIKSMQDMSGEALAMYDQSQLNWCRSYTDKLRAIEITKFDQICSHILDYMEVYTTLTAEEEAKKKEQSNKRKGDSNKREILELIENESDLMFGVWANVQGKSKMG